MSQISQDRFSGAELGSRGLGRWSSILAFTAGMASGGTSAYAGTAGPFEDVLAQSLRFQNGIQWIEPNGAYQIGLRFRMQNLAELSVPDADGDAARIEGQVRRLRLRFGGFAVDPRLTFQLQLSFSRADMDWSATRFPNVVRDANITYAFLQEPDRLFALSFGQAKLPGNRQRVISSGDQQFADRAIVNRYFNIDRDFGFQALYRRPSWNLRAAVTTGEGRNLPVASNLGLAYVGRIEVLPLGVFTGNNDMQEGDLAREPEGRLSLGLTYARFQDSNRAGGSIGAVYTDDDGAPLRRDQDVLYFDALWKRRGWSLYSELAFRRSPDGRVAADQALFEGSGALLQSGWFFAEGWELAARYARVLPLARSRVDPANRDLEQTTAGVTRYLSGHRVKIQGDVTRQTRDNPSWLARLNLELGI
jgi:hypothetical protein